MNIAEVLELVIWLSSSPSLHGLSRIHGYIGRQKSQGWGDSRHKPVCILSSCCAGTVDAVSRLSQHGFRNQWVITDLCSRTIQKLVLCPASTASSRFVPLDNVASFISSHRNRYCDRNKNKPRNFSLLSVYVIIVFPNEYYVKQQIVLQVCYHVCIS